MQGDSNVSDVKLGWAHLTNGSALKTDIFPPHAALKANLNTTEADDDCLHSVLIAMPNADTVIEIREWLSEMVSQYKMYGRYEWIDLGYRVTREVKGLRFHFKNQDDAVFFKFRWATGFSG